MSAILVKLPLFFLTLRTFFIFSSDPKPFFDDSHVLLSNFFSDDWIVIYFYFSPSKKGLLVLHEL